MHTESTGSSSIARHMRCTLWWMLESIHDQNVVDIYCYYLRFVSFLNKVPFVWQVATFIVQKILLDDVGLDYICTTAERFFAVGRVLGNMVASLADQPSSRLLKHIIRCYLRLSDNPRLVSYAAAIFMLIS